MRNKNLTQIPRRFDMVSRFLMRSALASSVLLGVTLGCSGAAEGEFEGDEPIGSASQPLTIAEDPSAAVTWDGAQSLGIVPGANGTPAVTSSCVSSYVVFTRAYGKYKGAANGDTATTPWALYGPRSFASSPSIAGLPVANCVGLRFIVVGRGAGSDAADRHIYWSNGKVTRTSDNTSFNPPVAETYFAEVSSRTFSGDNGYPAVTSSPQGDAYLAFRDGNTIYAHTKPADSSTWGAENQAPPLPTGWVPVGTPAIEYGFFWGPVTIVVRAQSWWGQTAFFSILYDPDFRTDWFNLGGPPSGSPEVQSDPAIEWNSYLFRHTLYYLSDGSYYQASFFLDEWDHSDLPAKRIIHTHNQPKYSSAPGANGDIDIEQTRRHWVVGRSGSEIFFSAIQLGDGNLAP